MMIINVNKRTVKYEIINDMFIKTWLVLAMITTYTYITNLPCSDDSKNRPTKLSLILTLIKTAFHMTARTSKPLILWPSLKGHPLLM